MNRRCFNGWQDQISPYTGDDYYEAGYDENV